MIEFQVDMSGNLTSESKKMAEALHNQANSVKILRGELSSLETRLVKAAALGNAGAFNKLSKDLDMVKKALEPLAPAFDKAAAAEARFAAAGKKAGEDIKAAENAAKLAADDLKAHHAAMASDMQERSAIYAQGWATMGAAAARAAVVVVTAISSLVAAGFVLAIEATMAKEKLVAMFGAMGGGREAGARTVEMLDKLGDEIGVTTENLTGAAKAFMAMGITDLSQLRAQVKATAAVAAVMGEEGAAAYEKLIAKTKEAIDTGGKFKVADKQIAEWRKMGLPIDDIAKKMGMTSKALEQGLTAGTINAKKFQAALTSAATTKFGGNLKDQALEPMNLLAKFRQMIFRLFDGMKEKAVPFLQSVQHLIGLFSDKRATGAAMKVGLTTTFSAIFDAAKRFVDWLSASLPRIINFVLRAILKFREWRATFDELNAKFGLVQKLTPILEALGTGLVVVLGIVSALSAAGLVLVGELTLVSAAIVGFIGWLASLALEMVEAFGHGVELADGWVDGIVDGIAQGAVRVVDAAKDMARKAVAAVTDLWQSHSPSVVMTTIGRVGFAGGLALGIASGAPAVADASSSVAAAAVGTVGTVGDQVRPVQAAASAAAAPPPWQRGASSSSSTSATENHFHFAPGALAVQGAGKSAEGITEEMIAIIFEKIAMEMGT